MSKQVDYKKFYEQQMVSRKKSQLRRRVKFNLMEKKLMEMNVVITDREIDDEMKKVK